MSREGRIEKDDLSVKDPFGYITESALKARLANDELKKQLEIMLPLTEKMLSQKAGSVAEIQKQTTAINALVSKQKEAKAIQEKMMVSEKAFEKARLEQIKIEQARERNIDQFNKKLEQQEKLTARQIKAEERLKSSYFKVQDGLTKLGNQYRELAIRKELGEKLSAKEELRLGRLQLLTMKYDSALKKVDANMGRHQRSVGNYASGFDGLSHSINQLTREAPAFAVSMNTGFLALSNNIPMLFDELSRIKRVNGEIIAQGGKVNSVWSQLGKSIFSFNTLISVAVTLLTLYGGKLISWIGSLIKGKKATDEFEKSQKQLAKAQKDLAENVAKESSGLLVMIARLKATNKGSKERVTMINAINDQYGTTLKNISDEVKFQSLLNSEVEKYIKYKEIQYRIQKNEDYIKDNLDKQFKAEQALNKAKKEEREAQKKFNQLTLLNPNAGTELGSREANKLRDALLEKQATVRFYTNEVANYQEKVGAFQNRITDIAKSQTELGLDRFNVSKTSSKDKLKNLNKLLKLPNIEDNNFDKEIEAYLKNYWTKIRQAEDKVKRDMNPDLSNKDKVNVNFEDVRQIELDKYERQYRETYLKIIQSTESSDKKAKQIKKEQINLIKQQIKLEKDLNGEKADTLDLEIKLAELQNDNGKKMKKGIDDITNALGELNQITTDFFRDKLQAEINALDSYLAVVNQNYDLLADKAANGNLLAQESLKEQLRIQKELNDEKLKAEQKQAKLALIGQIVNSAGGIIQGFESGTEGEVKDYVKPNLKGVGIDNTLVRVHGKERIINGELSSKIAGHKTSDVINNHLRFQQMMSGGGSFAQNVDLSLTNQLLSQLVNRPTDNYNIGEITQQTMEIVRKEVNGNKTTNHIYKAKYR